jgi:protein-tyrosine phosphatase
MRFAVLLTALGLALVVAALLNGGWCLLALWPAATLLALGCAYAGLGPGVCGKRSDGTLMPAAVLLLLPYLLATWTLWHLVRLLSNEPCCNEVAPGLWLGRRPFAGDLPPGVGLVVDLTAEFAEPPAIRLGHEYLCIPTLDASAPDYRLLQAAVERIAAYRQPVYVHCAQGHGRSAALAAAVLIRRGLAKDVAAAEAMLRSIRPGVRLSSAQRRAVDRCTKGGPIAPSPDNS